jgi:hypothetical protein
MARTTPYGRHQINALRTFPTWRHAQFHLKQLHREGEISAADLARFKAEKPAAAIKKTK